MADWLEILPSVVPGPGIPPELVASFIGHLPDYYTVVDQHGIIVTFSRLQPNTRTEDILGKNIGDLALPEERWKIEGAIAEARRTGQVVQFEGVSHNTEGPGRRYYILRVVPLTLSGWEDKVLVVSTDMTLQRQFWEEHRRHGERLAQFFDHSTLLAITLDTEMRFTEWNAAAEQLFGYNRAEVLGRAAYEFFYQPEQAEALRLGYQQAVRDRTNINDQRIVHVARNGERVICDWFAIPLIGERGETLGIASLGQDVTQSIRSEEALREAKRLAEVSAREKSRFLAKMSHELRTPLHGILGALELLQGCARTEQLAGELEIIRASSHTLLTVVNDVLDFSRIESGGVALVKEAVDLARLLSQVQELLRPLAEQKRLSFTLEFATPLPQYILGDADRLRQILVNLVSNAIKFTERGGVTLRASATREEQGLDVAVEVQDTGIGIREVDQKSIFKEFFQVEGTNTRSYGGTGLGLAISHNLAQLMEGSLEVQSTRGLGSTFTLRFPTMETSATSAAQQAMAERDYGRRVLLVDDNGVNVAVCGRMLERLGIEVAIAANGVDAVAKAMTEPFDLVLMDLHMPEMDGIEATRAIRELGGSRGSLPILGITANVLPEDRERCLAVGMNSVLLKPFRYAELVAALDEHFPPEDG